MSRSYTYSPPCAFVEYSGTSFYDDTGESKKGDIIMVTIREVK
jgi:flagellar basal body L-ring protein FlgH